MKEVNVIVKIYDDIMEFPFPVHLGWDEDEIYRVVVDYVMSNIEIDVET